MTRAGAAAVVLALALLAGCGGSSEPNGVHSPDEWAAGVCGAVRC